MAKTSAVTWATVIASLVSALVGSGSGSAVTLAWLRADQQRQESKHDGLEARFNAHLATEAARNEAGARIALMVELLSDEMGKWRAAAEERRRQSETELERLRRRLP
jgi:hypothetical protein